MLALKSLSLQFPTFQDTNQRIEGKIEQSAPQLIFRPDYLQPAGRISENKILRSKR